MASQPRAVSAPVGARGSRAAAAYVQPPLRATGGNSGFLRVAGLVLPAEPPTRGACPSARGRSRPGHLSRMLRQ
eukprot:3089420-Amphidinium_carterae.1